ncbi:unnamed protein product, partial [Musa acuminata var. zebrina]
WPSGLQNQNLLVFVLVVSTCTEALLCFLVGERGGHSCQDFAGQDSGNRQPRRPGGAPSTAGSQGRLSSPKGRRNGGVGTALAAVETWRNFRSLLLNLMKRDWGKEQIVKQGPYMHMLNQLVGEMMRAPEVLCNKKSMGNRVRSVTK